MFLFKKKPGRKKKTPLLKKIIYWFGGIFFVFILLPILVVASIFSQYLFLLPQSSNILGLSEDRTYLVTLHNEGELRPELGFLSSFIIVEIKDGTMNMDFHDSYDVEPSPEYITAPDAIENRFKDTKKYAGWTFRDSNFDLEHPQNSQQMIEFLHYDPRYADKNFDGVISLDLYAIGQIIDSVGGIDFDGKTLNSQNIFSVLESNAKDFDHHSEDEWLERKSSLSPLASQLIKEIVFSPFSWKNFSQITEKLLEEKHLLLFFTDPKIQEPLEERKWTGEINIPDDAIVIGNNIANIGGRKADRYIRKQFYSTFSVAENGKITEKLQVQLQHEGTRTLYSDRYFAEIRIIRAKGTLQKDTSEPALEKISLENKDLEMFSFPVVIDPSSQENFSFEFTVPKKIHPERSALKIFSLHQAGSIDNQIHITFQGEGNTGFIMEGCEKTKSTENISQCSFTDTQDTDIKVWQSKDTQVPILERSEWNDTGTTLEIVFSEAIEPVYPSQVFLRDKNSGTAIEIQDIKTEEKKIILTLPSPTLPAQRKFYTLQIENLQDRYSNSIDIFRTTVVFPKEK